MKSTLTAALVFLAVPAFAQELICQVSVNMDKTFQETLDVPENGSAFVGEVEGFRIRVNARGSSKFELEVFEGSGPSRSYAEGFLRTAEDEIKWTLWTREILLEASCRLAP